MSHARERRQAADIDPQTLAEARAGVEAIFKKMAEERERRANWWTQPDEDRADRLVMRNIIRDETVVIMLDGGPGRRGRKTEPVARMWWDQET